MFVLSLIWMKTTDFLSDTFNHFFSVLPQKYKNIQKVRRIFMCDLLKPRVLYHLETLLYTWSWWEGWRFFLKNNLLCYFRQPEKLAEIYIFFHPTQKNWERKENFSLFVLLLLGFSFCRWVMSLFFISKKPSFRVLICEKGTENWSFSR